MPTEPVSGLAADATDGEAVARVYEAKGRPAFNPLIVHVEGLAEARMFAALDEAAERLAERHWPGPLTLVQPLRPGSGIASLVTAGLSTVAVRAPAHPAMGDLLAATGTPLPAPRANASGRGRPACARPAPCLPWPASAPEPRCSPRRPPPRRPSKRRSRPCPAIAPACSAPA